MREIRRVLFLQIKLSAYKNITIVASQFTFRLNFIPNNDIDTFIDFDSKFIKGSVSIKHSFY